MLALPGDYKGVPLDRALEQIFNIGIDPAAHEERMALIKLVTLEAPQYPELSDILRRHGADKSHAELAKWLGRQATNGLIQIDDVDDAAWLLMDMVFGAIAARLFNDPHRRRAEDLSSHIRRCVSIFLHGVQPR